MAINTNAQNVIIGDSLVDYCTYQESASRYAIPGKNHMGQPMMIPIGEHILSRHMLLLGGIGTGKSNAFNHIIRNTRSNLTNEDVMIIFDTKGDFYKDDINNLPVGEAIVSAPSGEPFRFKFNLYQ